MRALWVLVAMVACEGVDEQPMPADSAVDTGVPLVDEHAYGGQVPGLVHTRRQPLSTFPLDGRATYDGELPVEPVDQPFALHAQLTHDNDLSQVQSWRLDVGIRAGQRALDAHNVGVSVAFNPQAVRRYQLRGAVGTGQGIEPERILSLPPGSGRGATFDLIPMPRPMTDRSHPRFLGTVTLSWTEQGMEQHERVILEAPAP